MQLAVRQGRALPWMFTALGGGCIAIGVLTGASPKYGLLAAVGLMFAIVTLTDLTVGYLLFILTSFSEAITNGQFFVMKVVGLILFASWVGQAVTRRDSDSRGFVAENPWLTATLLAMLCWAVLSATWATSPSTALSGAARYALDMMIVPIAFAAARKPRHAAWILAAFIAGAVLSGVYGLIVPTATGSDAGRLTGLNGDANGEATVLATALPLLIGLSGAIRSSARLKLLALIAVIVMFVSLVETLSREGLLSLAAALVAGVVFGGRWRRRAAVLLAIGVLVTVGYYFVLAPSSSRARVTMNDSSGRSTLWTVAWRVFRAHPLLGAGNDNFVLVAKQYINRPGQIHSLYVVKTPKVVHNAFLEALADLGIPGLLTLLAVFGTTIGAAVRAARIFERLDDERMEMMSRSVVLAIVALLTTDIFVSGNYAKYLWIPLAMAPVMLKFARRAEQQELDDAAALASPTERYAPLLAVTPFA